MNRRHFMKSNMTAGLALAGSTRFSNFLSGQISGNGKRSYIDYVKKSVLPKESLDVFLNENSWAQFDPDVGYILGNYMPRDGIDGSSTISTVMRDGKRYSQMYADRPCRINTYGNSFTQCHQVSDGETWQEYLAAHLGEPIRNFGMGGFGIYQAYRRLLKEEQSENGAEYTILYMWGDDYFRSVLRCRYVLFYPRWDNDAGYMFHGNFWSNIEMDVNSGHLIEKKNMVSSREELYQMTDPDFMIESLKDDLMLQLCLLNQGTVNVDVDVNGLKKLADMYQVPEIDFSDKEKMQSSARLLKNKYGFDATKTILKKAHRFAEKHRKKLMLIHFDPYGVFKQMIKGESRYDKEVIDFIREQNYRYFDMNEVHLEDFKNFNLSLDDYMKRYFIGHYSPAGNHFFAFSIKNNIVDWLDPKPITYRDDKRKITDFKGYLPG